MFVCLYVCMFVCLFVCLIDALEFLPQVAENVGGKAAPRVVCGIWRTRSAPVGTECVCETCIL